MVIIRSELIADSAAIEQLLDEAFGRNRFTKISYRYRDNTLPVDDLGFVAADLEDNSVTGTIRYWPVNLEGLEEPALLLGPVAIKKNRSGRGIGRALVFTSLLKAEQLGYDLVFLVGDETYYQRFGFERSPANIQMPNEDPRRLLIRSLSGRALPDRRTLLMPIN